MSGLHQRFAAKEIVVAPGVYDALSAAMAEEAGFEAAYVSGASVAYTQLGRPDIGLVTMNEVAGQVARMRERVALPLIVDADTGFGNALNTQRAVRVLESAGASAIQLEDQTFPKRCGHLRGKGVIAAAEMAGKVKAACDARRSDETLIIARTDAIAVDGVDAALDRALLYAEAGADLLFVEAPRNATQLGRIACELAGVRPLLANMVEGGDTPPLSAAELESLGFSLVIFPGALVRAFTYMASDFFATLRRDGTTAGFLDRMVGFPELNRRLGTDDLLALGQRYEDVTLDKDPA